MLESPRVALPDPLPQGPLPLCLVSRFISNNTAMPQRSMSSALRYSCLLIGVAILLSADGNTYNSVYFTSRQVSRSTLIRLKRYYTCLLVRGLSFTNAQSFRVVFEVGRMPRRLSCMETIWNGEHYGCLAIDTGAHGSNSTKVVGLTLKLLSKAAKLVMIGQ